MQAALNTAFRRESGYNCAMTLLSDMSPSQILSTLGAAKLSCQDLEDTQSGFQSGKYPAIDFYTLEVPFCETQSNQFLAQSVTYLQPSTT